MLTSSPRSSVPRLARLRGLWTALALGLSSFVATTAAAAPEVRVVEAKAVSRWYGKPPLVEHRFDVTLRNPSSEPRWLIVPASFPYAGDTRPAPGGDEVEIQFFELASAPRVVIVEGVAAHLWAVHLPGKASVTLRKLAIHSYWSTIPAEAELEVIVARELNLGGRPIGQVVGRELASQGGVTVDAPTGATDPRSLPFWHPRGAPLRLAFVVDSLARVRLALTVAP